MSAHKLDDRAKAFVVQCLACFDTPSEVAKAVKDEFGVEITKQAVEAYDPTKFAGRDLDTRWRELFEAEREAHKADLDRIAISHRATRLRRIEKLYAVSAARGNTVAAAALLVQAAREVGDVFTNRTKIDANLNGHEAALDELERGPG